MAAGKNWKDQPLSESIFLKKLTVPNSVVIKNSQTNRVNLTERVIADICREWSISEQWISVGEELVFLDNADPFVHKIVDINKSLNPDSRKYLKGYIDRLLEEQNEGDKVNAEEEGGS